MTGHDVILWALRGVGVFSAIGVLAVIVILVTTLRGIGRGPWGRA